jgi:hypothetical protein
MSNAKEEAVRIKAHAHEEAEKQIADARTQAERVLTLSLSLSLTGSFDLHLQGNWSRFLDALEFCECWRNKIGGRMIGSFLQII